MAAWLDALPRQWLWWAAQAGAALPLILLAWDWQMGNLTVNPIADFTLRTGSAAINLLLLTLAVTPVQTITGWRSVGNLRKSLGLWAFTYATLHLLVFVGLDYGFSLRLIMLDGLPGKAYILAGLAALLILLPLAITSTRGWMKRLGRGWKRLHRLVYVAGVLAVVHYIWASKTAFGAPTLYAIILAVLLLLRLPPLRRILARGQRQPTRRVEKSPSLDRIGSA